MTCAAEDSTASEAQDVATIIPMGNPAQDPIPSLAGIAVVHVPAPIATKRRVADRDAIKGTLAVPIALKIPDPHVSIFPNETAIDDAAVWCVVPVHATKDSVTTVGFDRGIGDDYTIIQIKSIAGVVPDHTFIDEHIAAVCGDRNV